MTDVFANQARSPGDPAVSAFAVIPDDASDLAQVTTALNVATPGSVRVTLADGTQAHLAIAAGQSIAVRVRRVWQSGTTATGITALV